MSGTTTRSRGRPSRPLPRSAVPAPRGRAGHEQVLAPGLRTSVEVPEVVVGVDEGGAGGCAGHGGFQVGRSGGAASDSGFLTGREDVPDLGRTDGGGAWKGRRLAVLAGRRVLRRPSRCHRLRISRLIEDSVKSARGSFEPSGQDAWGFWCERDDIHPHVRSLAEFATGSPGNMSTTYFPGVRYEASQRSATVVGGDPGPAPSDDLGPRRPSLKTLRKNTDDPLTSTRPGI